MTRLIDDYSCLNSCEQLAKLQWKGGRKRCSSRGSCTLSDFNGVPIGTGYQSAELYIQTTDAELNLQEPNSKKITYEATPETKQRAGSRIWKALGLDRLSKLFAISCLRSKSPSVPRSNCAQINPAKTKARKKKKRVGTKQLDIPHLNYPHSK